MATDGTEEEEVANVSPGVPEIYSEDIEPPRQDIDDGEQRSQLLVDVVG